MKLKFTLLITLIIVITIYGCEFNAQPTVIPKPAAGNELIINEIFTLPPGEFNAYSWIEVFNPSNSSIPWYTATNPINGWIAGSGGTLCWTTNTGTQWESYTSPVVPKFNSFGYFSTDTIFAVGDNGHIYRSNDSARTWFSLPAIPLVTKNLNSMTLTNVFNVPNGKLIWACGDSGTFVRSIDRGRTFTKINTGRKENLHCVYAIDIANLYVCGDSLIMRSTNGGRIYDVLILPTIKEKESYNGIAFLSAAVGRVVGSNGTVMFTDINGSVWKPETTNVTDDLNAISYLSGSGWQKAWVVGDHGTIIKADSAGPAYWQVLNSGTTANLRYVNFVDSSRGFACGDGGVIVYTTNGGQTWRSQNSGTTENLLCGGFLPPFTVVVSQYILEVTAERRYIYIEQNQSGQITLANPDFITRVDTGIITIAPQDGALSIKKGGFILFISDSAKFNDHTNVGPSEPKIVNSDLSYIIRSLIPLQLDIVKWNLLSSGEVRLVKIFQTVSTVPPYDVLGYNFTTIEAVRYGGYNMAIDYPQNRPSPSIPAWWSLARYQDLTTSDPNTMSTDKYFYICNKPIPGWVSQLRSH